MNGKKRPILLKKSDLLLAWCRCDSPSHIARGFMDAAGDLAERSVRAALGFHRTGNAVALP
ncbi:hypothetical protein, partial [Pseudomonas koreensis]